MDHKIGDPLQSNLRTGMSAAALAWDKDGDTQLKIATTAIHGLVHPNPQIPERILRQLLWLVLNKITQGGDLSYMLNDDGKMDGLHTLGLIRASNTSEAVTAARARAKRAALELLMLDDLTPFQNFISAFTSTVYELRELTPDFTTYDEFHLLKNALVHPAYTDLKINCTTITPGKPGIDQVMNLIRTRGFEINATDPAPGGSPKAFAHSTSTPDTGGNYLSYPGAGPLPPPKYHVHLASKSPKNFPDVVAATSGNGDILSTMTFTTEMLVYYKRILAEHRVNARKFVLKTWQKEGKAPPGELLESARKGDADRVAIPIGEGEKGKKGKKGKGQQQPRFANRLTATCITDSSPSTDRKVTLPPPLANTVVPISALSITSDVPDVPYGDVDAGNVMDMLSSTETTSAVTEDVFHFNDDGADDYEHLSPTHN